jgi:hypothetical protein
MINK